MTSTWLPPISCTSAAQWGSQAKTLRSAKAGADMASMQGSKSSFRIFMGRSYGESEGMGGMGAHGHDVLQEDLVAGDRARGVVVQLQADAAELAVREIQHGAVALG